MVLLLFIEYSVSKKKDLKPPVTKKILYFGTDIIKTVPIFFDTEDSLLPIYALVCTFSVESVEFLVLLITNILGQKSKILFSWKKKDTKMTTNWGNKFNYAGQQYMLTLDYLINVLDIYP